MAKGQNTAGHPNRQVGRDRYTTQISRHGNIFIGSHNINDGPGITGDEVGAPAGPVRLGGNFGKGPALTKNDSGSGYRVKR